MALVLCCYYEPLWLHLQSSTFQHLISFYTIYIGISNSLYILSMIIIYYYYYFTFHRFFTPVLTGSFSLKWRVTASLQNSSQYFSWSSQCSSLSFFHWSPIPPIIFPGPWGLFEEHQQQLISPSTFYSTDFSALWPDPIISFSFIFILWSVAMAKFTRWPDLFFL